jgi:hypothetical protein
MAGAPEGERDLGFPTDDRHNLIPRPSLRISATVEKRTVVVGEEQASSYRLDLAWAAMVSWRSFPNTNGIGLARTDIEELIFT